MAETGTWELGKSSESGMRERVCVVGIVSEKSERRRYVETWMSSTNSN